MSRQFASLGLVVVLAATLGLTLPSAYATPVQAPAPVPVGAEKPLIGFVPRAASVTVQKNATDPDLGNTLVVVALSGDEIGRLKKETGRTDLFVVGADDAQVLFRDDGREGDGVARDGHFSSLADIDPSELAARAAEENLLEGEGNLRAVPIFENRAVVGEEVTRPFNITAFNAGEATPLSPSGSISSALASPLHHEGEEEEQEVGVISSPSHAAGMSQFQDRVLMIHDPPVVADPLRTFDPCTGAGTPMGPWTFGHAMTEMANQPVSGINPSTFVEDFLLHWASAQTINSFPVPARPEINDLIQDWRNASGGGDLDLSIAPFRLLAINPRIDLRTTVGGGGGYGSTASGVFLDAGEARLTFGIVLPPGYTNSKGSWFDLRPMGGGCDSTPFSVILEYRVPKCKCEDVRAWARAWVALDDLVPGTAAYNSRLEKLTRTFTDANANRTRPNRSAIGQVRTNEIAIHPGNFLWEIREFQLRQMPWSMLEETTTADTPEDIFNNTITFGNFVLDTINGVIGPAVPLFYPAGSGNEFLGGNPRTPFPPASFFWRAPNLTLSNPAEDEGRHLASLGTCNGCHAGETGTDFTQIDPRTPTLPVALAGFLTGITITDPAGSGTVRTFDDLDRREVDINRTARMLCANFHVASPTVALAPVPFPGPLGSDGEAVGSLGAPATTNPDSPLQSVAIEDFLRETMQQVH